VDVPEQVVAILQARSRHYLLRSGAARPRQVRARGRLQQLLVVDEGTAEVAGGEVHQVQALADLHPRGVRRGDHLVAAVVEVHVQVAAVPAGCRRVETPRGPVRHLDSLPGRRVDIDLHPLELESSGGDDV
jgi:hypothetical protein